MQITQEPGIIYWQVAEQTTCDLDFYAQDPSGIVLASGAWSGEATYSGFFNVPYYTEVSFFGESFVIISGVKVVYTVHDMTVQTLPEWVMDAWTFMPDQGQIYVRVGTTVDTDVVVKDAALHTIYTSSEPSGVHIFTMASAHPGYYDGLTFDFTHDGEELHEYRQVFSMPNVNFPSNDYTQVFIDAVILRSDLKKVITEFVRLWRKVSFDSIIPGTPDATAEQSRLLMSYFSSLLADYPDPEDFMRRLLLWFKYQNLYVADPEAGIPNFNKNQKQCLYMILRQVVTKMYEDFNKERFANVVERMNKYLLTPSGSDWWKAYGFVMQETLPEPPDWDPLDYTSFEDPNDSSRRI